MVIHIIPDVLHLFLGIVEELHAADDLGLELRGVETRDMGLGPALQQGVEINHFNEIAITLTFRILAPIIENDFQ